MPEPLNHAAPVDLALCREMLSRVCDAIWHGRTGKHLWTIPVDESRDFDCLFMSAFDELERLRANAAAVQQAGTQLKSVLANYDLLDPVHGLDASVDAAVRAIVDQLAALDAAPEAR